MPLTISTQDDEVIESGPLAELASRPNAKMTGRAFFKATSSHLDLFGKALWWIPNDNIGLPSEVLPINPLQMQAIMNPSTGELEAWRYYAMGRHRGQHLLLSPEEVHPIIDPDFEDPGDMLAGLSPRRAVMGAIAQHYKADIANEASLDNGVEPGGLFTTDKTPTETQLENVKRQLNDRRGAINRRRHLVLSGGMDWKTIGASFKDMEFSTLKSMTREDICAAFGVPPAEIGFYEDSNYAHAEAASSSFWQKTILPRAAWLAEEWDQAVLCKARDDRSLALNEARRSMSTMRERTCPGYTRAAKAAKRSGQRFYAWFDSSGIASVQKTQLALVETVEKWNRMGVPLNEILQATDAPFQEQPWGNTWHKPLNLIDVNTPDSVFDSPDHGPEAVTTEPLDAEVLEDEPIGTEGEAKAALVRTTEAAKTKLWQMWRNSWAGLERAVRSKVSRHFDELRRDTLKRLEQVQGKSITQRDLAGIVLFSLEAANKNLLMKVQKLMGEAYRLGGQQSMDEAAAVQGSDSPDPFNIKDPAVERKLRTRLIRLTQVNKTLRTRLAHELADGVVNQETTTQLADRIRSEFKFASKRANTIARTEVGAAVEEARHEGRTQARVPMKTWLWSRKESGRTSHQATEAATMKTPVANDGLFTIAGTGLTCEHPRAYSLPAKHSANCGCTTLPRYPGDNIKSVLARFLQRGFLTYEKLMQRNLQTPQED